VGVEVNLGHSIEWHMSICPPALQRIPEHARGLTVRWLIMQASPISSSQGLRTSGVQQLHSAAFL
jgi:hypothetical protein